MLRVVIISCICASSFLIAYGKRSGGGPWNRGFLEDKKNYTVNDYIEQLIWKAGNETAAKGLQFQPADYKFHLSDTLLGLNFEGDVFFENGLLTSQSQIVDGNMALEVNRSLDRSTAKILFAVGIDKIETTHELRTVLQENNAEGSVETTLIDVCFIMELNHTYASGANKFELIELSIVDEKASYKIIPRTASSYAIETLSKENNSTNLWYEEPLVKWQQDHLVPLLTEQSGSLPFPINPY